MNGNNPKASHNRVCRLAIEKIGDKVQLAKKESPIEAMEKVSWAWLALKAVHIDCKEGLDKNLFEDEWMEHKYLDVIESFEKLIKKEEAAGITFGTINIDDIKIKE